MNTWTINGTAFPRAPSDFHLKMTKANVSYQDMLDGTQRRQQAPRKNTSRDLELNWAAVSPSERNLILKTFAVDAVSTVEIGGLQPRRQFVGWFEDYEDPMTKEVYAPNPGFGGIRYDLKLIGRMKTPFLESFYQVPSSTPSLSSVNTWFGGPTLTAIDGLPVWDGNPWQHALATTPMTFSNLGSAPWLPVIFLQGPLPQGFRLVYDDVDIDGTGQGVTWTWTGNALNSSDFITIDTFNMTVKLNGLLVNAWELTATSSGVPFPYWPALPPGENDLNFVPTASGSCDMSNQGQNRFSYT